MSEVTNIEDHKKAVAPPSPTLPQLNQADIDALPDSVKKELSASVCIPKDSLDAAIIDLFKTKSVLLTADHIIVYMHKDKGEVIKRSRLNNCLSRMVARKQLRTVQRGVFALPDLPKEEDAPHEHA